MNAGSILLRRKITWYSKGCLLKNVNRLNGWFLPYVPLIAIFVVL